MCLEWMAKQPKVNIYTYISQLSSSATRHLFKTSSSDIHDSCNCMSNPSLSAKYLCAKWQAEKADTSSLAFALKTCMKTFSCLQEMASRSEQEPPVCTQQGLFAETPFHTFPAPLRLPSCEGQPSEMINPTRAVRQPTHTADVSAQARRV